MTSTDTVVSGGHRDLVLTPPLPHPVRARPGRRRSAQEGLKRGLDIVLSLLGLLFTLPLWLLVVVAIRLESPGGAIFTQTRIGRGGVPFEMYKFRSMRSGAEADQAALWAANEGQGPLFKLRRDPRITRVGRWLRVTSIDELPQLVNVLKGDMSLVGPRPALPREVADYDRVTRSRLMVRPGLTGPWQVSGRSDLPWERALELDLSYVTGWSVLGDLRLLLRTVVAVISARGAY